MGEISVLEQRRSRRGRLRIAASAALLALALAGCQRQGAGGAGPGANAPASPNAAASDLARYATGAMKNLAPSLDRALEPALPFDDGAGQPLDLSRFRGKVVVMNLWATWCGPCVTEMPTLAALQKHYEGTDLVVVPISVDRKTSIDDVKSFIGVHPPLSIYNDPTFAIPMKLKVFGLPTTIIYDREGHEVARVKGEAKWDSPEALALIDHVLKEKP
jgi:thiol-disulfide isomerase/thioredoxin